MNTNSPLGRGDLIRSGPAFLLIDECRPDGSVLGYRLLRQTRTRTRNEHPLPLETAQALGLPARARWLVRLRRIRIPTEASREHIACAPAELMDELVRHRMRITSMNATEGAVAPQLGVMAALVLMLAACATSSSQAFLRAQREACSVPFAHVARVLTMPDQRVALRTVCGATGGG